MSSSFFIPGPPVAKGRPRMARTGHVFTPAKTVRYESTVALAAQECHVTPLAGPLTVEVLAVLPRPKRLCRRADPVGRLPCNHRPDLDNLLKAVLDGLGGIAWDDDGQVYALHAAKIYAARSGDPVGVYVTIHDGRDAADLARAVTTAQEFVEAVNGGNGGT